MATSKRNPAKMDNDDLQAALLEHIAAINTICGVFAMDRDIDVELELDIDKPTGIHMIEPTTLHLHRVSYVRISGEVVQGDENGGGV